MWDPRMRPSAVVGDSGVVDVVVVERYLSGWQRAEVDGLLQRIEAAGPALAAHGVRYVRSVVIEVDETCLCVFEGPDPDTVLLANHEAGLPVDRVVPASSLPD